MNCKIGTVYDRHTGEVYRLFLDLDSLKDIFIGLEKKNGTVTHLEDIVVTGKTVKDLLKEVHYLMNMDENIERFDVVGD